MQTQQLPRPADRCPLEGREHRHRAAARSAYSPGKQVAAAALAEGSQPRSRKPKHLVAQPSVAGAGWHLRPGAVTFNLPLLLRGLEQIPQPTMAALVLVFSGLSFL